MRYRNPFAAQGERIRTVKPHTYQIEKETYAEQRAAGRYNPASVLIWRGLRHAIGAGDADNVDVFEQSGCLYVLATNRAIEYIGLQIFQNGEQVADCFCQDESAEITRLLELTPINAAKRLAAYCDV